MKFNDMREFIETVDRMGELERIDNAHWNLEIGAITELMAEKRGPALLFDHISDYPAGYRILANPFANKNRTALAIGLPTDLTPQETLRVWRQRLKEFKPLPPVTVKGGPILENVITGSAIDFGRFPTPKWHEHDGGRYIGTGCSVITRDPEEGWVNIGTYKTMQYENEKDLLACKINRSQHGRAQMDKYHAEGKDCPVVITFGQDPAVWMASTDSGVRWGVSEYDFAGWMRGAPVEVIQGEYTGLPIPATAEIAIEGFVSPLSEKSTYVEGPCGEWYGYYHPGSRGVNLPVVKVKAIYHRNDPIMLGSMQVKPPAAYRAGIPLDAASLWDQIEAAGIEGVKGVWYMLFPYAVAVVISIKQLYPGHGKQAALAASGTRSAMNGNCKMVIVVDEDVDITNNDEVMWAVITRCNPEQVEIFKGLKTNPDDPMLTPEQRAKDDFTMGRLFFDACRPYTRRHEFPRVNKFSDAYRLQIQEKWQNLFK
ncbi:MAG: UbiD family decarboxylase [Syntrophaceae bacterium]|nr:UbiD family decarboxylase [Syntrophaceae bacterium]